MAEVLLFHHAQGLTPGVRAFADDIRAAGHIVHTPDLFNGRTFPSIEEGLAYIGEIGFDEVRFAMLPVRVSGSPKTVPTIVVPWPKRPVSLPE